MIEILYQIIVLLTEMSNIILAISVLAGGVLYTKGRIENKQLTKVLDKSSEKNEDLHKLAITEGLFWAARGIKKLIRKNQPPKGG
jgi:uncharacterized membrane protein YciS (DUF1049 family)